MVRCPYCDNTESINKLLFNETSSHLDINRDELDEIHVVKCSKCNKNYKVIRAYKLTYLDTLTEKEDE